MIKTIKVKAYCGCYVGPFSLFEEPDECGWEAVVEVDAYEWANEYVHIDCPKCGAELNQGYDLEEIEA